MAAMAEDRGAEDRRAEGRKGGKGFAAALSLALFSILVLLALAAWQVQRSAWKTALIARIEARVDAAPVSLPPPSQWASLDPEDYEYRRVTVSGTYLAEGQAEALALTERGAGFWAMTPLRLESGEIVYINRGFAPQERPGAFIIAPENVTVTGLMRAPEPGGLFLRPNDPVRGRWYSRDVAAMGAAAGLAAPAPFFIDRAADDDREALPAGGMTRIDFPNNHLLYAVQFLLLALVPAGGAVYLIRYRRHSGADEDSA